MVAIIVAGFWPSYFGLLFRNELDKELFIHVHALVYVSWMALFITQIALVATRRVALHRKVGQFGLFWGDGCVGSRNSDRRAQIRDYDSGWVS